MDFDRTSPADSTQDLRSRTRQTQERLEQPPEVLGPPLRAEHGGPTAAQRPEQDPAREDLAKARKRQALSAVARFLSLPGDTEVDIEVDFETRQLRFQIRDRATGRLIREIPEGEAETLIEKLREFNGALIDRSL